MKTKQILFLLFFSISILGAYAQGGQRSEADMAKYKEKRAEFLKKELQLTDTEAAKFMPVVDELMQKKFEINKDAREKGRALRQKATKTDADYQAATEASLNARIKEAELQKEYFVKFNSILPAEKVYKYQQAEMKFMQNTLDQRKEGAGNPPNGEGRGNKNGGKSPKK